MQSSFASDCNTARTLAEYPAITAALRDLATIPTQGIESTWSKVKGALQSAMPEEAKAAKGSSGPVSAISGARGRVPFAVTRETPCPAALPLGGRVLEGGR